jgi:hypothetical protein
VNSVISLFRHGRFSTDLTAVMLVMSLVAGPGCATPKKVEAAPQDLPPSSSASTTASAPSTSAGTASTATSLAAASTTSPRKKLIEIGFDAPTPSYLRANIATMSQQPFDGVMVNLSAGKTFLNKNPYPDSAFTQDRADLAAVGTSKLTDNFVTMWSAREAGWDWFSDSDWSSAQTNAANFAKTAKAGNFKGFMFDPEPYGTNPWSYSAALYPDRSFPSVQAKVRERGAAFMTAVQAELPTVKILTLFGPSIVKSQAEERGSLDKADWALFASFLDGMLDVIGPQARIIDGNEPSYYYTGSSDFDGYRALKNASSAYVSPENRTKYDNQVSIAHAVFVDGALNLFNSPRFFGLYLQTPEQRLQYLEYSVFHALRASDEYAWYYNEKMDWWGTKGAGVQVPDGLANATVAALQKTMNGLPLGLDVDAFAGPAGTRYKNRVEVDGRISTNGRAEQGQGLGAAKLATEFVIEGKETACQVTEADGYFQCFVPPNWNGKITPVLAGYTFDPPYFQADNITSNNTNVNFEGFPQAK